MMHYLFRPSYHQNQQTTPSTRSATSSDHAVQGSRQQVRTCKILAPALISLAVSACGGDVTPTSHEQPAPLDAPASKGNLEHADNRHTSTAAPSPDWNTTLVGQQLSFADSGTPTSALPSSIQLKAPAPRVLTPVSKGFLLNSSQSQRLYGPGVFLMNSLANTVIGAHNRQHSFISNRFKAGTTARLNYVRLAFATGPNYSKGNGGAIRITIRADDGSARNLPNMNQILGSATYYPNLAWNTPRRTYFHTVYLQTGQPLQSGRLYHVVIENLHQNTAQNFISIDHAATHSGNGRPSRWISPKDWATLFAARPTSVQRAFRWRSLTEEGSSGNFFSPIMELGYANGHVEGVADVESGSVEPRRVFTARANRPIRERFTPSRTLSVSGLSVATSAAVGGNMRWRLLHQGQQLATGIISQYRPNHATLRMNTGTVITKTSWYDINLPGNVQMRAGQTYDLEFHPEGNSQWKFAPHRNGASFGFKWPAAFTESQAQHHLNGNWVNTHFWNYNYAQGERTSNWPVVLHLAP